MRIALVLAALAVAGVASAQTPAEETAGPAPDPAPASSAIDDEDLGEAPELKRYDPLRMLCRRVRPPTGTRIGRGPRSEQVCLTMAEWERREEIARQVLEDRDRGICGSNGCGPGS